MKLRSSYIPHLYFLDHRYEDHYVALIHGFGHGAQQDQWSELMPRPASERTGMRLSTTDDQLVLVFSSIAGALASCVLHWKIKKTAGRMAAKEIRAFPNNILRR